MEIFRNYNSENFKANRKPIDEQFRDNIRPYRNKFRIKEKIREDFSKTATFPNEREYIVNEADNFKEPTEMNSVKIVEMADKSCSDYIVSPVRPSPSYMLETFGSNEQVNIGSMVSNNVGGQSVRQSQQSLGYNNNSQNQNYSQNYSQHGQSQNMANVASIGSLNIANMAVQNGNGSGNGILKTNSNLNSHSHNTHTNNTNTFNSVNSINIVKNVNNNSNYERNMTDRMATDRLVTDRMITDRNITSVSNDRVTTDRNITNVSNDRHVTLNLTDRNVSNDRHMTDRNMTGHITDRMVTDRNLTTDRNYTERTITEQSERTENEIPNINCNNTNNNGTFRNSKKNITNRIEHDLRETKITEETIKNIKKVKKSDNKSSYSKSDLSNSQLSKNKSSKNNIHVNSHSNNNTNRQNITNSHLQNQYLNTASAGSIGIGTSHSISQNNGFGHSYINQGSISGNIANHHNHQHTNISNTYNQNSHPSRTLSPHDQNIENNIIKNKSKIDNSQSNTNALDRSKSPHGNNRSSQKESSTNTARLGDNNGIIDLHQNKSTKPSSQRMDGLMSPVMHNPETPCSPTNNQFVSSTIGFLSKDDLLQTDIKQDVENKIIDKEDEERRYQEEEKQRLIKEEKEMQYQEYLKDMKSIKKDRGAERDSMDMILSHFNNKKKGKKYQKHDNLRKIEEKYQQFDIQTMAYNLVKEYSHLKLKSKNTSFEQRMLFDIFKRQTKNKRIQDMIQEKTVRHKENTRIHTFNRLIDDANRRLENKMILLKEVAKKEEEEEHMLHSKKYKQEEWENVYEERFQRYNQEKDQKLSIKREEALQRMHDEEEEILENIKQMKGDEKFINQVVGRLIEDAERRKIGITKRCKNEERCNTAENVLAQSVKVKTTKFGLDKFDKFNDRFETELGIDNEKETYTMGFFKKKTDKKKNYNKYCFNALNSGDDMPSIERKGTDYNDNDKERLHTEPIKTVNTMNTMNTITNINNTVTNLNTESSQKESDIIITNEIKDRIVAGLRANEVRLEKDGIVAGLRANEVKLENRKNTDKSNINNKAQVESVLTPTNKNISDSMNIMTPQQQNLSTKGGKNVYSNYKSPSNRVDNSALGSSQGNLEKIRSNSASQKNLFIRFREKPSLTMNFNNHDLKTSIRDAAIRTSDINFKKVYSKTPTKNMGKKHISDFSAEKLVDNIFQEKLS